MKYANEIEQIPNVDGVTRFANLVLGSALIASVFVVAGTLGWVTLLPIIAVYPMFVAITGYSLHRALLNVVTGKMGTFGVEHKKSGDEFYRLVLH